MPGDSHDVRPPDRTVEARGPAGHAGRVVEAGRGRAGPFGRCQRAVAPLDGPRAVSDGGRTMTLIVDPEADLALAIERAGAAKSSFYAAMKLLPVERRNAMFAIYAFCREVDDIADEPAPEGTKPRELALWRDELEAIYAGGVPAKPLARALMAPVERFGLQKADFLAVIDGMAMDAD